ncbi:MAG: hypothetical protein GYA14_14110 [Ignavibacteria bacterium]|nr:hypothetical protein [Ignavibacteria bacterium]
MFEKYFIAPVFALIKTIIDYIGNPASPSGTTLSKMVSDLLKTRVIRTILYSATTNYTTSSSTYEVKKTFTITLPYTPTSINSIMLYLTFSHGSNSGSSKWEIGFGDSPATWTILGENSTTSSTNFTESYVPDPSIYENNAIIKIRLSIKKGGTSDFTCTTKTLGYIDIQYS